jgi:Predicted thioesterase
VISIGLLGRAETIVDEENTAIYMGSGNLEVFATPAMVALMEQAASESIAEHLADGESSVGTSLQIKHLSATPVAMKVWTESVLKEIDGKRLVFEVKAYDKKGLIGEGTHERFVISAERFMERTEQKKHS